MDQEKIGKFIAYSRKKKNLTQEQLAEKLNISKNAVSKWERGLNLPDACIMQNLCELIDISLNELFAGEVINDKDMIKQSEKNILDLFKFNYNKNKKYKSILILLSIFLIISLLYTGKFILIKTGYSIDNNLRHFQRYEVGVGNIKGEVDTYYFENVSMDFEIGANKYGYAVFKNPKKAYKKLKRNYSKGIRAIQKEFGLLPLSNLTFRQYKIYGWQLTDGTNEEKEQARFVSSFFDVYENSFN